MNGKRRWVFPTTRLGLALLIGTLLANDLVSAWNISRLVENERRVVRTQKVLTTLEEVLATVTEAETGERGFLITGAPRYLEPYRSAVARSWNTLEQLTTLTADDPAQQARIRPLRQRVGARFEELRQAIAAQKARGFDAARQSVSTNHGRQLMNEMRDLVGQMKDTEGRALALRAEQSRRSAQLTAATGHVAALLGIGLVCLAFYLLRRDFTLRKRADEATRQLAAIVQSSDDAIIGETLDGIIVSWNEGAERLYGYSAEEALDQPVSLLVHPEQTEEVRANLERLRRGFRIEHFETSRIRNDGRPIDVSMSLSPIKDDSGQVIGVSAIGRDITERKRLQREVLEIASREQRRIGQDLHDGIGQELTGLAMLAQRLAGLLVDRSAPEAAAAARIATELEHALHSVRSLSRGLVPVEVDCEGLMVALAELTRRTSELHGITCTFSCNQPVCILDNQTATHLYRMSQEAITNAIKHGRAHQIVLRLEEDANRVTLEVCDDGVGLPERAEETTGTGLRIMRYRAELIGARLAIESARPGGTRVTCSLRRSG